MIDVKYFHDFHVFWLMETIKTLIQSNPLIKILKESIDFRSIKIAILIFWVCVCVDSYQTPIVNYVGHSRRSACLTLQLNGFICFCYLVLLNIFQDCVRISLLFLSTYILIVLFIRPFFSSFARVCMCKCSLWLINDCTLNLL